MIHGAKINEGDQLPGPAAGCEAVNGSIILVVAGAADAYADRKKLTGFRNIVLFSGHQPVLNATLTSIPVLYIKW